MNKTADARTPRWTGVGPALEILALWALAAAQPLFDIFGRNAAFFLASGTGPVEIVAFGAVVAFGVPTVLIAVEWAVRRWRPRWADRVHSVFVGGLATVLGLNVARQLGLDALYLAVPIAVAFVFLIGWARRRPTGALVLRYLGVAPLVFVALFCFASDAGSLVLTRDAEVIEVDVGTGDPVAVIVLDELPLASLLERDGDLNAKRFPNFARLAAMSTWYRNTTAMNPSTPESVPTVLTGQVPESGRLPTSADRPVSIFTLLGGAYEVDVFEGVTDLCPDEVCAPDRRQVGFDDFLSDLSGALGDAAAVFGHLTLPEPMRDALPSVDQSWTGFLDDPDAVEESPVGAGDDVVVNDRDQPADFLAGRADAARARGGQGRDLEPLIEGWSAAAGSLLVGHDPFLPHRPWHLTPTGALYDGGVGGNTVGEEVWPEDPVVVRRALQRHLLQVGYADHLLGELLDRFEAAGTLDEATIAVTADHGIAFDLGGQARVPTEQNLADIYRVPLFVKAPGQADGDGEVSDVNALLIDVLPTILDLVGVDLPDDVDVDGVSLVDPAFARDPADKPIHLGSGPRSVPGDFSAVLPSARRNADLVGDGDWVDLLRVGAAGALVDQRVRDVDLGPPVPGTWTIDQDQQLGDVPEGRGRPVAVNGRLDPGDDDLPDGTEQVLIAVDGILAGIGDLDPGNGEFIALLDEQRLTPGAHEIDLYVPWPDGSIRRVEAG